jgi:hypothetical protein
MRRFRTPQRPSAAPSHEPMAAPAPPGSAQEGGLPKFRLEPLIGRIAPMPVIVLVSPASPKQTFACNRLTTPFMQTDLPLFR